LPKRYGRGEVGQGDITRQSGSKTQVQNTNLIHSNSKGHCDWTDKKGQKYASAHQNNSKQLQ
jgi:hypothetical protein